jgi:hypothetical protein
VVKTDFLPGTFHVAVAARFAEVPAVQIMVFVTPYAFRRRIAELDLRGVTFHALDLEVSAFEWEIRECVIKSLTV